jgi:hypothetical protein
MAGADVFAGAATAVVEGPAAVHPMREPVRSKAPAARPVRWRMPMCMVMYLQSEKELAALKIRCGHYPLMAGTLHQ